MKLKMKVLKKGPGWSLEQICTGKGNGGGGCGATLLVEKNDIYMTSRSFIDGSTDYYYTFRCPCCQVETDIEEKLVPSGVKKLAMEKRGLNY